jgi:hypothetical protein
LGEKELFIRDLRKSSFLQSIARIILAPNLVGNLRRNEDRFLSSDNLGGKTKMERKYTVMLCCLALLFLGSVCYGQPACGTPWPKHTNGSYSYHYYFGCPNGQGPNGQWDSAMVLYLGSELQASTVITGVNLNAHDFGPSGYTFKAMECRTSNGNTISPCPVWNAGGLNAKVSPVPYVSNWMGLNQYCFTTPYVWTGTTDHFAVVQYTYMGNYCAGNGMPMVPGDADGGTGSSYAYWGSVNSCGGVGFDWWLCLVGLEPPPPWELDFYLKNQLNRDDCGDSGFEYLSTQHPMCKGNGLALGVALTNNTGGVAGPVDILFWIRSNTIGYSGFAGTGIDFIEALTGSSPFTLAKLPPITFTAKVPLVANLGVFDYSFGAVTLEGTVTDVPYGGTVTDTSFQDMQMTPKGVCDDNTFEVVWYLYYPAWGDAWCKMFDRAEMPQEDFVISHVDHGFYDYSSSYPMFAGEIRQEGTFGRGTPDLSVGGLIATFDPSISTCCPMQRKMVYGSPCYTTSPCDNIYVNMVVDPRAFINTGSPHAMASSTAGEDHIVFNHSYATWGGGLPYASFGGDEIICRLVFGDCPLDGGVGGSGELRAKSNVPTCKLLK